MRLLSLSLIVCVALAAGCAPPAAEAPAASTAPSSQAAAPVSSASPSASGAGVTPSRPDQVASNMRLVGKLALPPPSRNAYGDLTVYGDLALIGRASWNCPPHGVDIIDISDPAQPAVLSSTDPLPGVATEDLAAVRIAGRDVLVVGLQACDTAGQRGLVNGLDLWDISDPRRPARISQYKTLAGVHEFGLASLPDGRVIALLAVPGLETISLAQGNGSGDLLIVDISDPRNPQQIGEWGVLDEPELGRAFAVTQLRGGFPFVYLHSVRASPDGKRALLSYWDAGVIILDISDPSRPRYQGRTVFAATDEGNAHSVAVSPDGKLLVQADEDIHPRNFHLRSNAFAGEHVVHRLRYLAVAGLPITGTLVDAGRNCASPSASASPMGSPDVEDKVALIEAGGCPWEEKIARAQMSRAAGVILYDTEAITMPQNVWNGDSVARMPDAELVMLRTPAVYASVETARALLDATAPVTVESGAMQFDGWGGIRLFDIADPARPTLLSSYRSPAATDPTLPSGDAGPWWTAHDPFLDRSTLYVSWYSDGVRVLDIADPRRPREIGHWAGLGAPADAPRVFIWGAVAHNGYVFAADMNFGLYVLELEQN